MFRLRPTARQHVALAACGSAPRAVQRGSAGTSGCLVAPQNPYHHGDQSAQLTEIRAARPDQAVWSFSSQQATLRRLDRAFAGFFGRVRPARRLAIRGLGAARFDSVEWPKDGDGARWLPMPTGCICKVSARSRFRCIARCRGR